MERLTVTEFFNQYGYRLVDVNGEDLQTGSFRIFAHEKDRVERYQKQGFQIATIWQEAVEETEETVTLEFENSREHPFVTGYFILLSDESLFRTPEEIENTLKYCQDAVDEYAKLGHHGEEGDGYIYEGWVEALNYVLGKAETPDFSNDAEQEKKNKDERYLSHLGGN